MRVFLLILAIVILSGTASATIYYWTDEEGVVHITDNLKDVPERYRGKTKKMKESAEPAPPPQQPSVVTPTPARKVPAQPTEELYGGYSLEWWKNRFVAKRRQLSNIKSEYEQKKRFVEVFEKGRQFGKTFTEEEIASYNQYKEELPALKKAVEDAQRELEELQRRARISGVPRSIRGD